MGNGIRKKKKKKKKSMTTRNKKRKTTPPPNPSPGGGEGKEKVAWEDAMKLCPRRGGIKPAKQPVQESTLDDDDLAPPAGVDEDWWDETLVVDTLANLEGLDESLQTPAPPPAAAAAAAAAGMESTPVLQIAPPQDAAQDADAAAPHDNWWTPKAPPSSVPAPVNPPLTPGDCVVPLPVNIAKVDASLAALYPNSTFKDIFRDAEAGPKGGGMDADYFLSCLFKQLEKSWSQRGKNPETLKLYKEIYDFAYNHTIRKQ